jgi:SAM-dependent methyltransferase
MVANLKRRLAAARLEADVRTGDGQALPWRDDEFHAAFSMFGLMFFPDRGKGFRELFRVLESGGSAVVSSWAPFEGIFARIMAALREQLPDIPFGSGKGPLGDPEELASEFEAAGFEKIEVRAHTHTTPGDVPSAIWAQCQRTTAPIVLLKRKLGEARWSEVTQGIVSRLEAEYGTGRIDMTTTAYLGCGKKP